jgi:transposase InsO family protein
MDLLSGPEEALDGYFKYLLVIIDDYIRYLWIYGLRSKYIEVVWKKWLARVLRYYSNRDKDKVLIKWIRSDNGGEFISGIIQA